MSDQIRIIIVEDQWMIRDGLAAIAQIDENITVVATGGDGSEALALVAEHQPDVVLMDIQMPIMDGIEATSRIRREHPGVNVLILTTFEDDDLIEQGMAAGAIGYLTKDIAAEKLANAIATAASGIVQLSPQVAARILPNRSEPPGDDSNIGARLRQLTSREQQVLRILATGATNREIASELHLSTGTVKNHVSAILRQLDLTDRTQAAVLATKHGFS